MPNQVCMGAMMMCTFGMAPSSLVVLPVNRVMTNEMPDANIMDHIPMVNIMPFGMCMSVANPTVAAATAAALGVLTPMPCIPATPAPLGAGSAHGSVGQYAHARQRLQIDVHLGRRHLLYLSGRGHGRGSVKAAETKMARASNIEGI